MPLPSRPLLSLSSPAAISRRRHSRSFWTEEECMRIFVQVCLALDHIHAKNILHRDLKPGNVFLTSRGVVKLGDFGIARTLETSMDLAGTQIGTPLYLSPEICDSQPYGRKGKSRLPPISVYSIAYVLVGVLVLIRFSWCTIATDSRFNAFPCLID
jgi:serine/threonine protein kinase